MLYLCGLSRHCRIVQTRENLPRSSSEKDATMGRRRDEYGTRDQAELAATCDLDKAQVPLLRFNGIQI